MTLRNLIGVLVSLTCFVSYGQVWFVHSTASNTLFNSTSTNNQSYRIGNVGIGSYYTTQARVQHVLGLGSATDNTKLALFYNGTQTYGLGYQANQFRFHLGGQTADRFSFFSNAGNAGESPSAVELMTLNFAGKLGIGVVSPEAYLHVVSSSNTSLKIGNTTYSDASIEFNTTNLTSQSSPPTNAKITAINRNSNLANSSDLAFFTGTTSSLLERMRIDANGKIGVGLSTTPEALVHLSSPTNTSLKISNTSASNANLDFSTSSSTSNLVNARVTAVDAGSNKAGLAFSTNNGTLTERMRIADNGNVGIGNFSAETVQSLLHLRNGSPEILITPTNTFTNPQINFNNLYRIRYNIYPGCGSGFFSIGSTNSAAPKMFMNGTNVVFGIGNSIATGCTGQYTADGPILSGNFLFDGQSSTRSLLVADPATVAPTIPANYSFSSQGKSHFSDIVAIGYTPGTLGGESSIPNDVKLRVKGKILCEELKVKLSGNWPDYVFDKNYKLASLDSVETFIQENHHLPEVPSAKEIQENGVNTGEMNAILLRKIEELTLYMIEQQKQIEELKKKNEEIEAQLK